MRATLTISLNHLDMIILIIFGQDYELEFLITCILGSESPENGVIANIPNVTVL
jgi:hypothetical protein